MVGGIYPHQRLPLRPHANPIPVVKFDPMSYHPNRYTPVVKQMKEDLAKHSVIPNTPFANLNDYHSLHTYAGVVASEGEKAGIDVAAMVMDPDFSHALWAASKK